MQNKYLIYIFRGGFLLVLFYEIFRWKFLNSAVIFSWEGLIATVLVIWALFEIGFYFLRNRLKANISWVSFALAFSSLSLDAAGDMYGWYATYSPWFDKIAHFFGGFVVAIVIYDVLKIVRAKNPMAFSGALVIPLAILIALFLGVGYESLEYMEDKLYWGRQVRLGDGYDTVNDLHLGLMGAVLAMTIVYLFRKKIIDSDNIKK